MTIALRQMVEADVGWLEKWLPQAAAVVASEHRDASDLHRRCTKERRVRARIIVRRDVDVGIAIHRLHAPQESSAIIELIATPPEHGRKGTGMAAAALVEDELRSVGITAVYAPASAVHGISMYFWIRLGYAPLLRAEWPCEREGVAWLRRSLADA